MTTTYPKGGAVAPQISVVDLVVNAVPFAGGSQNPSLNGGDLTTGISFRPLRNMSVVGARFWSMSQAAPLTWDLKLWDLDNTAQLAVGTHVTGINEAQKQVVMFGAAYSVVAGDVNRKFAVSFHERTNSLYQFGGISQYSAGTGTGCNLNGIFLSRDLLLVGANFYANGDACPLSRDAASTSWAIEPIITIP